MIDLHILKPLDAFQTKKGAFSLMFVIVASALQAAQATSHHQDYVSHMASISRMMRSESRHEVLDPGEGSRMVGALGEVENFLELEHVQGINKDDKDCEWDDWSDWSVCQFTCGEGISMRYRKVLHMAQGSGKACGNNNREERNCTKAACPVDCKWNDWSDWTACSATCGSASRYQQRTMQAAQFGGHNCSGLPTKSEDCNYVLCPVDCEWSDWNDWGGCSKSCGGGGEESRTREIKTPKNSAGRSCEGEQNSTRECGFDTCPVDCAVADWGAWELCSVSCGTGTTSRKRSVTTNAAYGGAECPETTESHSCSPGAACVINCVWSDWSDWQCASTCGQSTKSRVRTEKVSANHLGTNCTGKALEEGDCSLAACPMDCTLSEWTSWTDCSVSCGPGVAERSRSIASIALNGGHECNPKDLLFEKKYCSLPSCAIDCQWVDWSEWSDCSATCGGESTRSRFVKVPASYGGKECTGDVSQARDCEPVLCPVDCMFTDWSAWQSCSVSCGTGSQKRERSVQLEANNGGTPCSGDYFETQQCTEKTCPVDCAFEDWGEWEPCTSSCGAGVHKRYRGKIDAQYGGADCVGNLTDVMQCPTLPDCPVDCLWEDWTAWSDCSVSCGIGALSRLRKRAHYEAHGGHVCYGTEDDVAVCELSPCPLDCFLEDWAPWSDCTTSCGNGTHVRSRSLTFAAYGGKDCVDPQLQDAKSCEIAPCPVHCELGDWSLWTLCSKSCGGGLSSRSRTEKIAAMYGGNLCTGSTSQDQACNANPCPVDCPWADWTDFDACTTTCGGGTKKRSRVVWVAPAHGGAECDGSTVNQEVCNDAPCPVDCRFSDWSAFTTCSQTCNGGMSSRSRSVVTPSSNGGLPCVGDKNEDKSCNTQACPVDCQWDEWSPWTTCSLTCHGGITTRQRNILAPASDGGAECTGESLQESACGQVQCPVDCVVTNWSSWSGCSASCGGGINVRFRIVHVESAFGGVACPSDLTETLDCSEEPCPVDCKLGEWRDWEACSTSCGSGKRVRTRLRENERNGGLPCKESLVKEEDCYVVPSSHCPQMAAAVVTASGGASAATASATATASAASVAAASATSAAAKSAAVEVAEALKGTVSPEIAEKAAHLAATGDSGALRKYLEQADIDSTVLQGVLGNLSKAEDAADRAAEAAQAAQSATGAQVVEPVAPVIPKEVVQEVARLAASGDAEAVRRYLAEVKVDPAQLQSRQAWDHSLGGFTNLSTSEVIERAMANLTVTTPKPLKGSTGPIEVLRLEGNLYLYTPDAEDFVSNPAAKEGLQLLIAGKAQLETKNVEVALSIPKRMDESEWQKKAKGNVRAAYKIHVYSETGDAAAGDVVMQRLKQVDEESVQAKLNEIMKDARVASEISPVSMTMEPYKMP